jgi:fibronectin-binding autotransporter adhesin
MTVTNSWSADISGDWATAADWSLGLPVSSQAVLISTANIRAITHDSGTDIVASLTVGQDIFAMNGGSLSVLGTASFADGYDQNGGVFQAASLAVTGTAELLGGAITGSTTVSATGSIVIGNFAIDGSAVASNAATIDETAQVTVGDVTGIDATINNKLGGVYDFAADTGIGAGAVSASFVNAGTLEKSAGVGDSAIVLNVTDTGQINVETGTIELDGANNSVTGSVIGAGTIAFGGGGITTLGASTFTPAGFVLNGAATVNLTHALSFTGSYVQSAGNASDTLNLGTNNATFSGAAIFTAGFGQAYVEGSGTLNIAGTTGVANTTIGGTVTLKNTGTLNIDGTLWEGDGSGQVAGIVNAAGAVINFVNTSPIVHNVAAGEVITNAGSLVKNSSGTTSLTPAVASTGTINVQQGVLELDGTANSITGSVIGAGALQFNDGATASFAPATLSVAALAFGGSTTVTLGASESFGGAFFITPGNSDGVVALGGKTLTLSGTNTFSAGFGLAIVQGPGSLALAGTSSFSNFELAGTVAATNSGLINATGQFTIGDGSGNVATFNNGQAGTYDLAAATGIGTGSAAGLKFTNAGLLELTAGGTASIGAVLASTGTVSVGASGVLALDNANNVLGGQVIGAGALLLAGASTTLSSGVTLSVAAVTLGGAAGLTVDGNLSYAGTFTDAAGNSDNVITLTGNTFTVSGPFSSSAGFGQAIMQGSGTLYLTGNSVVDNTTVGGTVMLRNAKTFELNGNLTLGNTTQAAGILNNGSGVINLTGGASILNGSSVASTLTNTGRLANTGTVFSTITTNLVTSADIAVGSAGIELLGSTDTISGAVGGAGTLEIGAGTASIAAKTSLGTGTLALVNASTLDVLGAETYKGGFVMAAGGATDVLNVGTSAVTLTGAAQFVAGSGVNEILGTTGVLALDGIATVGDMLIGSTATVENEHTLFASGNIQLGDSSGLSPALLNAAGALFAFTGDTGIGLGTSPLSTITNSGTFEKAGGGGTSDVAPAFVNTATVLANSGTLQFAGGVTNSGTMTANGGGLLFNTGIAGTGTLKIAAASTVDIQNASAAGQTITFASAGTGVLALQTAGSLLAQITGMAVGDAIDLTNVGFTGGSALWSAGTLTVGNSGGTVAHLKVAGSGLSFTTGTDGHSGLLVTLTAG